MPKSNLKSRLRVAILIVSLLSFVAIMISLWISSHAPQKESRQIAYEEFNKFITICSKMNIPAVVHRGLFVWNSGRNWKQEGELKKEYQGIILSKWKAHSLSLKPTLIELFLAIIILIMNLIFIFLRRTNKGLAWLYQRHHISLNTQQWITLGLSLLAIYNVWRITPWSQAAKRAHRIIEQEWRVAASLNEVGEKLQEPARIFTKDAFVDMYAENREISIPLNLQYRPEDKILPIFICGASINP